VVSYPLSGAWNGTLLLNWITVLMALAVPVIIVIIVIIIIKKSRKKDE
jgi:hypothetical protein